MDHVSKLPFQGVDERARVAQLPLQIVTASNLVRLEEQIQQIQRTYRPPYEPPDVYSERELWRPPAIPKSSSMSCLVRSCYGRLVLAPHISPGAPDWSHPGRIASDTCADFVSYPVAWAGVLFATVSAAYPWA